MNDNPAVQRLVDRYYAMDVSALDQALLDFVFAHNPTQEALDRCLAACDIEALGANKVILLTYVAHEHPELRFSAYAGPRVMGLNTFYRFANMKTLAHFARIGKAYNAAGIPMLLFKGGAMKVLRPSLSRPMGDVDVLIPVERMDEAVRLAGDLGYVPYYECASDNAVDLHTASDESAVDVHHSLYVTASSQDCAALQQRIVARAAPCHAFGVDVLLPCHEDLFFLVLNNLAKNLHNRTSLHGIYFALCDCRWLLDNKCNFDWDIVRSDVETLGSAVETRIAAEFMNRIVPGLIPDPGFNVPDREAEYYCNRFFYDQDYFFPHQKRCQQLRVLELKKAPCRWVPYLAKYLIMEKLRDSPAFVRWFLRRKERMEASRVH